MIETFAEFGKISRLSRNMIVTEKLDGTNASVTVDCLDALEDSLYERAHVLIAEGKALKLSVDNVGYMLRAGSRSRWIYPGVDNFAFAKWVWENAAELLKLGEGSHFGEWWGAGIQRGYDLNEKRFSLFNTGRWSDATTRPACCGVVPTLFTGNFDTGDVDRILANLKSTGSVAAPGYMNPEGVVVFHEQSRQLFKKTLDKNDGHKG